MWMFRPQVGAGRKCIKASTSFKEISQQVDSSSSDTVYFYSTGKLILYTVTLQTHNDNSFNTNFINAVKNLLVNFTNNPAPYSTFIGTFGTHYVTSIDLGASFGTKTQASAKKISQMQSRGTSWENAASASLKVSAFVLMVVLVVVRVVLIVKQWNKLMLFLIL